MGFVRKRPSRTRGTRSQAVASLDGARVQLGTYDSFALATDAWQQAETIAHRGGRAVTREPADAPRRGRRGVPRHPTAGRLGPQERHLARARRTSAPVSALSRSRTSPRR